MDKCNFCYLPLDECNCPGEMSPRRTGQQYFDAIIANSKPADKTRQVARAEIKNLVYGHGVVYAPVSKEFRRSLDNDDEYIKVELTYAAGIPADKRVRVTIEVLDDENN